MTKVSVITVSYNCEQSIIKTMESVLCQKYPELEYIVIDGNSSDRTYELVKTMESAFKRKKIVFIHQSEPDDGIFDAMNKGIKKASGEFILFLNSGDWLTDKNILAKIFNNRTVQDIDVIYGNHYVVENREYYESYAAKIDKMKVFMPFSHQAAFTRRSRLLKHPFNIKYTMCADYDFYLYLYLNKGKFVKIEDFISYFSAGGVSQQNALKTRRQVFDVRREQGVITKYNYVYNYFRMVQYILRCKIRSHISCNRKSMTHKILFDSESKKLIRR